MSSSMVELLNSAKTSALQGRLTTWDVTGRFVFAGNATFTLRSKKTGERFTYRMAAAKNVNNLLMGTGQQKVYFVSLLRGPSNEDDYAYMGLIDARGFHCTTKSRVREEAPSYKAFSWFFAKLQAGGTMPKTLEVWHEGRCGRCGRKLTVPESVAAGLGPECAGRAA